MIAELEAVRDELADLTRRRDEAEARRDELVRALMKPGVARDRIVAAAGIKIARLYQIRDGRR